MGGWAGVGLRLSGRRGAGIPGWRGGGGCRGCWGAGVPGYQDGREGRGDKKLIVSVNSTKYYILYY
jgi:hypothetical protein